MADVDALLAQVKQRQRTDETFRERLARVIDVLAPPPAPPEAEDLLSAAVGGAGLALHLDDIAAGRWTP